MHRHALTASLLYDACPTLHCEVFPYISMQKHETTCIGMFVLLIYIQRQCVAFGSKYTQCAHALLSTGSTPSKTIIKTGRFDYYNSL